MFESTCDLISLDYVVDGAGNSIATEESRTVFCKPRSVTRSEFYQAALAGLKPSVVLVLANFADYQDERVVDFRGKRYTVTRAYVRPDRDAVELTLEERDVNGK